MSSSSRRRRAPAGPHRLRRRAPVHRRHRAEARRERAQGARATTRRTPPRSPQAVASRRGARRTHLPEDRRQARARAGRGLPDRFRGRLRQPARRGRGSVRAQPAAEEVARGRGGADAAGRHRHPHQAAQRRAEVAQPAHARPVRHHACSNAPAACCPPGFVVTLPKITAPGAGRGAGLGLRRARARSPARARRR